MLIDAITSLSITVILFSIGFFLVFKLTGIYHFGLGSISALASYIYLSIISMGIISVYAIVMAVTITAIINWAISFIPFYIINSEKLNTLLGLIFGLGVYVIITNVISLLWGEASINIRQEFNYDALYSISIFLFFLLFYILKFTHWGLVYRAISCDYSLSIISNLPVKKNLSLSIFASGIFVCLAGLNWGVQYDLKPEMGMVPQMLSIVAVILGSNKFLGVMIGSIILVTIQQVSLLFIPSKWQEVVVFTVLLLVFTFKPIGLFIKTKE